MHPALRLVANALGRRLLTVFMTVGQVMLDAIYVVYQAYEATQAVERYSV